MSAIATPGSITSLMGALDDVHADVAASPILAGLPALSVYRWRPNQIDPPAIYNWITDGPRPEQKDTARLRDTFVIATRIGVAMSDRDEQMDAIETYIDAYRDVVDPLFWNDSRRPPVLGAATWAARTGGRMVGDEFGAQKILAVEFVSTFALDRIIRS